MKIWKSWVNDLIWTAWLKTQEDARIAANDTLWKVWLGTAK